MFPPLHFFFSLVKYNSALFSKFQLTNQSFVRGKVQTKLTKLSSDEETADSEKSSHDLLACESVFLCLGQFPRNCSISSLWASPSKFRAPYFPKWPILGHSLLLEYVRLSLCSRAAAFSLRIYFRSLELVEGQWQARWRVELAPTRVSLVNAVSCIKREIFSRRWARTEEGEEKQKQLGSNDKRANELTFRYWNSLQITSSRK